MGGIFKRRGLFSTLGGKSTASIGIAVGNTTFTDYVTGRDVVSVITFTNLAIGSGPAGNNAYGVAVYRFPAGTHLHVSTYMDVNIICSGGDSADVGLGSVAASGAVALLSGTATFEDYITGQTVVTSGGAGTNVKKMTVATAGALTGISINEAGGSKIMRLNVAANWTGATPPDREIYATGTIVIKWVKMS